MVTKSICIAARSVGLAIAVGIAHMLSVQGATIADTSKLPESAKRQVEFVKDIQPIFEKHCYSCHGEKQQKSGLRLDLKQLALKGGEHGVPLVPGKSVESRLIHLIAGLDPELVMPIKGERLSAEEISILRAWIDQGANWPDGVDKATFVDPRNHWAFKPPVRVPLLAVKNKKWVRNPIDAFVLARLEKEKLRPSPEADRVTLLRRLSLDLVGLPPTIEEVDEFLADKSPDAYEKTVERLLDSLHYGEKWGRHWLDAARYADSNGYEKDLPRTIWPYRDWVIDALNRDLPFDQFTIHQLAGDLIEKPTTQSRVATGFLRNSMLNEEGGIDPEQFRIEGIIDRIDAIGKTFLGLTIACAQCHNHKYDPISHKEYYEIFAFLNNDDEPELEVPTQAQLNERARIHRAIAEIESELGKKHSDIPEKMREWEKRMRAIAYKWTVLDPEAYYGAVGTKFVKESDKSLLAQGSSPPVSGYTVTSKTTLTNLTGIRLEVLTDPNLPSYGPGRADNGNFVLTEIYLDIAPLSEPTNKQRLTFTNATSDFSQPGFPVSAAIDGVETNKIGWGGEDLPGRRNRPRVAVFETKDAFGFAEGTELSFTLKQLFGNQHTMGRFRLSVLSGVYSPQAYPLTAEERAILHMKPERRSQSQQQRLFSAFRRGEELFEEENKKIDEEQKKWPAAVRTLVLSDRNDSRATHIFKRGDFKKPTDQVFPAVPAVLNPLPTPLETNRLGFARWIVDTNNPLTARVIVNRMWQHYFGQGFVPTPEDFGTRAEVPSHPELLDWLACEFMDRGWSMKSMHRLIVSSATYRQSSKVTPKLFELDQYNRLLARVPRLRVDAEAVRDIALASSGLLSTKIGGPSVYPPIPEGVMSVAYTPMKWETSTGEDRYRRGMYTFAKRTVPYPGLITFDAPNGESSCVRRTPSNTPLQALTTLNDAAFHEAAQALALRTYREGGIDDRSRAVYAFRLCTARSPDRKELKSLLALLEEQKRYFYSRTDKALLVALTDREKLPEEVNLHNVAAWTVVSRVLLNMDETITKE
jgi:mono/diheme cytochrome c family protein